MRIVVLICALTGLAGHALAADYRPLARRDTPPPQPPVSVADALTRPAFDEPVLRGSNMFEPREPDFHRWSGFYAGGQFAYAFALADFSGATRSLVAHALRLTALEAERNVSRWNVLGADDSTGTGFGGFVGYNMQWQDAVMGVEFNYTRTNINLTAPNSPITRATTAGGNDYTVTLSGAGSMKITDLATLRGRGGWVIGNLMPYGTLGFAVGRSNYSRSVTITGTENGVPFMFNESDNRKGVFMYGVGIGAGLEYAFTQNIFVRGEYEFTQFLPVASSRLAPTVHTVRAGVGFKF